MYLILTLQLHPTLQVYFVRRIHFFSEQTLRSKYSTIHAQGLVRASTLPRECTVWYNTCPRASTVEYTLLNICSENVLTMHLVIRRQAQARASVRMHSVRAYVMPYHIVTLQNNETL